MGDYKVLAEVSESIVGVIWQEIQADPDLFALIDDPNLISLESPAELEDTNQALLSVYLYRVAEDGYAKNQLPGIGAGGRLRKAPMALDLSYLITPLLRAPRDQQIVLGKIMGVLYDRPSLEGSDLTGSLADDDSPLRIYFNSMLMDEAGRIWGAIGAKYRLSVSYTVRVTMLDSTRERAMQRVLGRDTTYAGKSPRQEAGS